MTADPNIGTLVMAAAIVGIFGYLLISGRLPKREGELDRLRNLEAKMKYLQEEDIRKGQMIAALQTELSAARERIRFLEGQQVVKPMMAVIEEAPLMIVIGEDPSLLVDLAALRGIKGLRVTRLLPATYTTLKGTVERFRRQGKPIEYLHFSTHAGPEGSLLDRVVRREELSELLRDARIVVFMGCTSVEIADLLAIIPSVVAFREPVPHDEAWQFSLLFWRGISEGLTAEMAFARAVERGPTGIGEYAELIEL